MYSRVDITNRDQKDQKDGKENKTIMKEGKEEVEGEREK